MVPGILRQLAVQSCRVLMCGLLLLPGVAARAQAVPNFNDVFRSKTVVLGAPHLMPHWSRVLAQHPRDDSLSRLECHFGSRAACALAEWDRFIASVANRSVVEKIRAVNAEMNTHRYVRDIVNWGIEDYWATPLEYFQVHGDCEDFAIAKFYSLRRLGIPDAGMRIVVVYDKNLQIAHAVLAVLHDGDYLILDNLIPDPVPERVIFHYRPVYSVNESGVWLHETYVN